MIDEIDSTPSVIDGQGLYDAYMARWLSDTYIAKIPASFRQLSGERNLIWKLEQMTALMCLSAFADDRTRTVTKLTEDRLSLCMGIRKASLEGLLQDLEPRWLQREAVPGRFHRGRHIYHLGNAGPRPIRFSAQLVRCGAWAFLTPTQRIIYALLLSEGLHPARAVSEGVWRHRRTEPDSMMRDGCSVGDFEYVPSDFAMSEALPELQIRLDVGTRYFWGQFQELVRLGFVTTAEQIFLGEDTHGEPIDLEDPQGIMLVRRPFLGNSEKFRAHLVRFNASIQRSVKSCRTYRPKKIKALNGATVPLHPVLPADDYPENPFV